MATEPTWEELLGSNNWDGLLDPLNISLRTFILHCGDFSQTPMDAFNNDKGSKYAGSSRYGKEKFFEKVMFESASDYEVKALLYAPRKLVNPGPAPFINSKSGDSWDRDSNMIGYIAVTTDQVSQALGRREIYIVWRGTATFEEAINDFDFGLVSAQELVPDESNPNNVPKVMSGWLKIYVLSNPDSKFTNLGARAQLQRKVEELINKYKDEKLSIVVTGHSLGASLATLSAFDLVENGIRDVRVGVIVAASPYVGDQVFVDRVNMYPNLKVLHTFNIHDIVPGCPPTFLGYRPVGVEVRIDRDKSPYLKTRVHNHSLQGLLHTVSGWIGEKEPFEWDGSRSLALANKDSDILKDKYLIPTAWWAVEKNKGMVRGENGDWVLVQDEPEPEF